MNPTADTATPSPSPVRVSVLIRSIDRARMLLQALDSVAQQTGPAVEVLVVAATPGHGPLPEFCGDHTLRFIPTDAPLHRSDAANRRRITCKMLRIGFRVGVERPQHEHKHHEPEENAFIVVRFREGRDDCTPSRQLLGGTSNRGQRIPDLVRE